MPQIWHKRHTKSVWYYRRNIGDW